MLLSFNDCDKGIAVHFQTHGSILQFTLPHNTAVVQELSSHCSAAIQLFY